jgi:hypothetical protein
MIEYILTDEAQHDRDMFEIEQRSRGCSCWTGMAPCNWCTHPGNPLCQEDDHFFVATLSPGIAAQFSPGRR